MWNSDGNSEYSSKDGLWLIKPHTNSDGDNIKGDWALYAAGAYHWDYVASATTLKSLKEVTQLNELINSNVNRIYRDDSTQLYVLECNGEHVGSYPYVTMAEAKLIELTGATS